MTCLGALSRPTSILDSGFDMLGSRSYLLGLVDRDASILLSLVAHMRSCSNCVVNTLLQRTLLVVEVSAMLHINLHHLSFSFGKTRGGFEPISLVIAAPV